MMPTYTIFAGVNGAGKTSIYKSVYYEEKIAYIVNEDIKWKSIIIPNWAKSII